ncbi:MAG TPA: ATP-binding cassette domain-containing protein, partial [Microlunatus sp.]|nr:ATP-binding cassette domain-containing protein [Microlunatus sp.]
MTVFPTTSSTETAAPVVTVRDLDIDFWVDGTWYPAVIGASFDLRRGEVLALVGESGSGKSTTAMALLGLLPKNSHVRGSIELGGLQLVGADARELRSIRGRDASVIFQEPMTALNPVYTVGFQIGEMLRSHNAMSPKQARQRAIELLTMVEIPDPERRVDSYPHQLSGGQRQRAMIAQALACDPELLIADEPTTALDVTVQAEILKLMRDLKHRIDAAIVLITHDMGVVADMADRVLVMKDGRIVESGTADEIFNRPIEAYTVQLLNAVPHLGSVTNPDELETMAEMAPAVGAPDEVGVHAYAADRAAPEPVVHRAGMAEGVEAIVELTDVAIEYPNRGRTPAFRAVEGLTLQLGRGEVMGLVGESGS